MPSRQQVLALGHVAGGIEGGDVRAHLLVHQDPVADVHLPRGEEAQGGARAGADHHQIDVLLGGRFLAGGPAGPAGVGRAGEGAEVQPDPPSPVSTRAKAAPSRNS